MKVVNRSADGLSKDDWTVTTDLLINHVGNFTNDISAKYLVFKALSNMCTSTATGK